MRSSFSLLLSAVSGEDTQDRTDRAILTPWVKFLWESYRQCLDLLRNNNSVEKLYQDIAQQGMATRNWMCEQLADWDLLTSGNTILLDANLKSLYCIFSAFKFCLNYTRKTEFRKLCDNVRFSMRLDRFLNNCLLSDASFNLTVNCCWGYMYLSSFLSLCRTVENSLGSHPQASTPAEGYQSKQSWQSSHALGNTTRPAGQCYSDGTLAGTMNKTLPW